MPRQTENNANNVLGEPPASLLGKARVVFESTQVIAGHSGKQPDILVMSPGRSPVVIEAEYSPARTWSRKPGMIRKSVPLTTDWYLKATSHYHHSCAALF